VSQNPGATPALEAAGRLQAEEDRLLACVHCGFCLTACPTYTRLGNEADSPRGRLVLMRAVQEGRLDPAADSFRTHIDQCLGCRACEPVCPSGVQYGFLVERARAAAVDSGGQRLLARLLLRVFGNPALTAFAGSTGRVLRAGGLAATLARMMPRWLAGPRFGLAMLAASRPIRPNGSPHVVREKDPPVTARPKGHAGAAGARDLRDPGVDDSVTRGDAREFADPHGLEGGYPAGTSLPDRQATPRRRPRVALLNGCVQQALFAHVNRDTRDVLAAAGCDVIDVGNQQCCGALHAHSGELDHALDLARANIDAFLAADPDVIIVNAAGCGAMMKEYAEQLAGDLLYSARAHDLSTRVRDISEYLVELDFRPAGAVPLRVTYDAPCHLHHAQRITRAPLDLLARIPHLELVPLDRADECCGGAGIYGITHPDIGGRILDDKLDAIYKTRASLVLTPNPGCMMQIGAGLVLRGGDVQVMHPIELLARSVRAQ
jgi:glycolate oxidase iron-sulfur subunit